MEEKKLIPEEKKAELKIEQLDHVAGGLFIQTSSVTCSTCGKTLPDQSKKRTDAVRFFDCRKGPVWAQPPQRLVVRYARISAALVSGFTLGITFSITPCSSMT